MRQGWFISLLAAGFCWLGSGCAIDSGAFHASPVGYNGPLVEELPGPSMAGRGTLKADASALTTGTVEKLPAPAAGQYVSLSAADLQCLAAARSSLANLIEMERDLAASAAPGCLHPKGACNAELKDDLLVLRAIEERNRAAGTALELYYRLAEAEAGLDSIKQSQGGLDAALAQIAELRGEGIKIESDEHALRRRKLELLDQAAETELGREQAHAALKALLNLAAEDPTRIWPAADLKAVAEPLDIEEAVALGLAARAELIILRCLVESLTVQTLPGARAALAQRDPSLGASNVDARKLHLLLAGTRGAAELPGRRAQLAQLLAERERAAAEEIRSHAATVTTRLRQAALANEILKGRQNRLAELQQMREVGNATPFEVTAERLEITKAEAELMRRVIAWRIAQVKLKQAQGLLAAECGYQHEPCCQTCGRVCRRGACSTCGPAPFYASSGAASSLNSAQQAGRANRPGSPRIVRLETPRLSADASHAPAPLVGRSPAEVASRPSILKVK